MSIFIEETIPLKIGLFNEMPTRAGFRKWLGYGSHISHTMIPFRIDGFFEDYFEAIHSLHTCHRQTRVLVTWFFNVFSILACGYLILFYLLPLESLFWQHVFYDVLSLVNLSSDVKIWSLPIMPMMAYFYYLLYISPAHHINFLVRQILIVQRESIFTLQFFRGKPTSLFIRKIAFRFLHFFNLFASAVDIILLFFFIRNILFLIENYRFFLFNLKGIILLLLNISLSLAISILIVLLTHILILTASMAACLGIYFVMELEQVYRLLKRKHLSGHFPPRQLSHFMVANNRVLQWGFKGNLLYGRLLFAYLLVNAPLNAYLLNSIIHGKVSGHNVLIVMPFVIQQLCTFFVIHWVAASFSKRIHRCSKTLIHISVYHFDHCKSRRARLKLAHCIDRFHTKNQYGMTYGKFGLISLTSMTKYLMVYSKVMMITYKMLLKKFETT